MLDGRVLDRRRMVSVMECPCGDGAALEDCCGPIVVDGVPAVSAEQLMRSRYTAFALGREKHLWRTWHPRTRPLEVTTGDVEWTGLRILEVVAGGAHDDRGVVEFDAAYLGPEGPRVMRERSLFERRGGRWTYVEASDEVRD